MTFVRDIYDYLESIAPFRYQASYDNAGLLTGNLDAEVSGVLTCLDATEAIIEEAIAKGCNVVVAHHPIIFKGLKSLTGKTYIERTIIKAIKNDINIIAIHTNLDSVLTDGVNKCIADRIGLADLEILAPEAGEEHNFESVGSGIIGSVEVSVTEIDFLHHLKKIMDLKTIKHTRLLHKEVKKVAICGGSGSFLLSNAIRAGADIFITSDFKYHEFFDADNHIVIADIGHYESEKYTIGLLKDILNRKYKSFPIFETNTVTNPIQYL